MKNTNKAIKMFNDNPGILVPDRPIAFNRDFVRLGIGVKGALFLSQGRYWANRTSDENGWFYKTIEEWEEETGLTKKEQLLIKKILTKKGYLSVETRGLPAKNYFFFHWNKIAIDLLKTHNGAASSAQRALLVVPKGHHYINRSTESTTDITEDAARKNAPVFRIENDVQESVRSSAVKISSCAKQLVYALHEVQNLSSRPMPTKDAEAVLRKLQQKMREHGTTITDENTIAVFKKAITGAAKRNVFLQENMVSMSFVNRNWDRICKVYDNA